MPPRCPGAIVASALVLAVAAVAMVWPAEAPAACLATPACLEVSFPPDFAWGQLDPGPAGNDSAEQMIAVTSNELWGLRVASDLTDGRMTEWTGSAYVSTAPKVLSHALRWSLSSIDTVGEPPSYEALSSAPGAVLSSRPSTCPGACSSAQIGVRYRQLVSFADEPGGANNYRIQVTYDAGQGF
jgi:hypothetical protein